ncbi:hypothetical protein M9435_005736 [Picochlorum sp. BPE23]|nr:hypothetical protein M9435_005736 [Picochlorum sp. BPE23]
MIGITDERVPYQPFLSRHFLACQAEGLGVVPFPPPGQEDSEGRTSQHNILCLGGWNEEAKEYQLSLCNLCVEKKYGDIIAPPDVSVLASFQTPGCCSTVDVARSNQSFQGSSDVIVAGSKHGHLHRLRLTVPNVPGSCPSAIRLREGDFDDTVLTSFARPHRGPCTSVSVQDGASIVASVSLDGTLALSDLEGSSSDSKVHDDAGGAVSYTSCSWTKMADSLVTTNHQGRVTLWDFRDRVSSMCMGYDEYIAEHHEPLLSLASNPAKSHVCVTGSSAGEFSEWDFRYPKEPTFTERVRGAINAIRYECEGSTVERLRFCTDSGGIYKVAGGEAHLLYEEPHGVFENMCVSSTGTDSQIFCSSNQEGIIFISNLVKYF